MRDVEVLIQDSDKPAEVGVTAWPPALALDTEPVLRLFTGESFYSSADAAIREAVLNSIDAIARHADGNALEPRIEIILDRSGPTLTVSDNGDGMNQEDLTNLFSKVGASASRLAKSGARANAIGTFGIGALSYFLICDRYQVQTRKADCEPIGLEFSSTMLDGKTRATTITPSRNEVGTTLVMFLKNQETLELLLNKFPVWLRNVQGLSGRILPENTEIAQGGLTRKVRQIEAIAVPNWIEEADIGPPEELSVWDKYDGVGRIDALYRGVFVERVEINGLWGLEGAIHVNPKHFRPKLNREGFVGQELRDQVTPFLTNNHPRVLQEAVKCIHTLLESDDEWNFGRALTLWLAVPRNAKYKDAADAWDAEFRNRKAFHLLKADSEVEISISELASLTGTIYLAPDRQDQSTDVVRHAVRLLRARNETVVQGIARDNQYLTSVTVSAHFSSWLLLHAFKDELASVVPVETVAENLIRQDSIADVLTIEPQVKLVRLGRESAPILSIKEEIWINIDTPQGCSIVEEICRRNEGHLALWVACMMYASEQGERLSQIMALLRQRKPETERLGLVRRQYLRGLLQ